MPKKGAKHGWKAEKQKREFKDCKDAQKAIQEARDDPKNPDKATGLTEPYYYSEPGNVTYEDTPDGGVKAKATVKWRVRQDRSKVRLPDWSWPKMSAGDKKNRDAFQEGVRDHEEGHMKVAEQYTKDHPTTDIEGTGANRDEAVENLKKDHQAKQDEYVEAANKRSDEYDEATDHGASQSKGPETKDADGNAFPGGKDAILNCPGS